MSEQNHISAAKLWITLVRAHYAIAHYLEQHIADLGLGMSDFVILEVLLHKGPLTISAIGEKVLLASASMTSAIDRLEERGMVRRTNCNSDRRIRIIELTCEGKKSIVDIYTQHEKDIEFLMADLCQEERDRLGESLKKMGYKAKAALLEK